MPYLAVKIRNRLIEVDNALIEVQTFDFMLLKSQKLQFSKKTQKFGAEGLQTNFQKSHFI